MMQIRQLAATTLVALLTAAPRLAEACSVCTTGRDEESKLAFIVTTVCLSVLPLLCIGSVVWWLVRRAREIDEAAGAPANAARPASLVS